MLAVSFRQFPTGLRLSRPDGEADFEEQVWSRDLRDKFIRELFESNPLESRQSPFFRRSLTSNLQQLLSKYAVRCQSGPADRLRFALQPASFSLGSPLRCGTLKALLRVLKN
jgi:hypothetical protein